LETCPGQQAAHLRVLAVRREVWLRQPPPLPKAMWTMQMPPWANVFRGSERSIGGEPRLFQPRIRTTSWPQVSVVAANAEYQLRVAICPRQFQWTNVRLLPLRAPSGHSGFGQLWSFEQQLGRASRRLELGRLWRLVWFGARCGPLIPTCHFGTKSLCLACVFAGCRGTQPTIRPDMIWLAARSGILHPIPCAPPKIAYLRADHRSTGRVGTAHRLPFAA
jgi:hypothetical protein